MLTPHFSLALLRLLAIAPRRPEWTWLHMAWLGPWVVTWHGAVGERGKAGGGGGMSEGVMNTCMGRKWQFEELWPYRLQDMQKTHRARRGEKVSKPRIKLKTWRKKNKNKKPVCVLQTLQEVLILLAYFWCRKRKSKSPQQISDFSSGDQQVKGSTFE